MIFLWFFPFSLEAQTCEDQPVVNFQSSPVEVRMHDAKAYIKAQLAINLAKEAQLKKQCPDCSIDTHIRFIFDVVEREQILCSSDHLGGHYSFQKTFYPGQDFESGEECYKPAAFNRAQIFVENMLQKKGKGQVKAWSTKLWDELS